MTYFFSWYILSTLIGLLTFPLAYRMLPALPDRGYTASRALGLLLWGYLFWLLGSLGILHNDIGGLLTAGLLIALAVAWALRQVGLSNILAWLRSHAGLVISSEILFLITFAAWTVVRAANPEAMGTEKPMELAFINAILRSPGMPPHDPWLSGYAISYYYFGFVIVAMLAKATATPGSYAFNLGVALIFALSAVGAYGLLFNLLNAKRKHRQGRDSVQAGTDAQIGPYKAGERPQRFYLAALLGPLFVLLVSNLEGFLHSMHTRGLFWQRLADGTLQSAFWKWLDIKDLNLPPAEPFAWVPTRFWWWWRASRVLQDYDLAGGPREIIDEFPFFSYLLSDLHPHMLVMPFTFLVIALALNLLLGGSGGEMPWLRRRVNYHTLAWAGVLALPIGVLVTAYGAIHLSLMRSGLGLALAAVGFVLLARLRWLWIDYGLSVFTRRDLGEVCIGRTLRLSPADFLLAAITLGGLTFLNTWDFPFYLALFAAAYAIRLLLDDQSRLWAVLPDFIWMGLLMGACAGLLYLLFFLSFSSQAGGILPNLIYPTRGAHLWVMFGPLLLPIFAGLIYYLVHLPTNERRSALRQGFTWTAGLLVGLLLFALLLGFGISLLPEVGKFYLSTLAANNRLDVFAEAILRRVTSPGGWGTLLLLLGLNIGLLLRLERGSSESMPLQEAPPATDQAPASMDEIASPIPLSLRSVQALAMTDEADMSLRGTSVVMEQSLASMEQTASPEPLSLRSVQKLATADDPSVSERGAYSGKEQSPAWSESTIFFLLLTLLGGLLVLVPEFIYLRDLFGWRMNTIFKFYFQAWLTLSLAAAYASAVLLRRLRGLTGALFSLGWIVLLLASLVYPTFSVWNKTNGFKPIEWTLDSSQYYRNQAPDEMAAIDWLSNAPSGVVAEAVPAEGGSYSQYARVATFSGQPGVLGWVGHENQWRGGNNPTGSRQSDLQRLYCTRDWGEARDILKRYNIRYVLVSPLERSTYKPDASLCPLGVMDAKFLRNLAIAFQAGQVTVYEYIEP